jgi:hypothetical protein
MSRHSEHQRARSQALQGWSPRNLGGLAPSPCVDFLATLVDFAGTEGLR